MLQSGLKMEKIAINVILIMAEFTWSTYGFVSGPGEFGLGLTGHMASLNYTFLSDFSPLML